MAYANQGKAKKKGLEHYSMFSYKGFSHYLQIFSKNYVITIKEDGCIIKESPIAPQVYKWHILPLLAF